MLLAVDIGNTNITAGVFSGDQLVADWRLATDARRQPDEYAMQISSLLPMKGVRADLVEGVALCSVVPPLTGVFQEASRALFSVEPTVIGTGTRTGVHIQYDNPRDVGADRIVDAAAAYHLYGGPCIVVDLGTATVFDAITENGSYIGGSLAPGLAVAAESLFLSTSQLRRVELAAPPGAIGRNTVHAMQSGLIFGYAGLIESMVERFRQEMDAPSATVVATGGLASVLAGETKAFDIVNEHLTLIGLQLIYNMNREASKSVPRASTRP